MSDHLREVISIQLTLKKDAIIKIKSESIAEQALPGQYVCCFNESNLQDLVSEDFDQLNNRNVIAESDVETLGKKKIESNTKAYVFSVDKKNAIVELFVSAIVYKNSLIDNKVKKILCSNVQGDSFSYLTLDSHPVLFADETGLPAIIFLANVLANKHLSESSAIQPLVILYSTSTFAFTVKPSQFILPQMPQGVIGACPLLEDKNIPSRLLSDEFIPGCYDDGVENFMAEWLIPYLRNNETDLFIAGNASFIEKVNCLNDDKKSLVKIAKQIIEIA